MTLNSGTNVRLDPDLKTRLQRLADSSGIKVAQLIRMAIEEYCDKIEHSGQVIIPIRTPANLLSNSSPQARSKIRSKK